jgi:DNA-binding NarL/FixJ family response regulator
LHLETLVLPDQRFACMNSTSGSSRPRPSEPAPRECPTVIIVDDHPIVRRGLKMQIERNSAYRVCAETDNAPEALSLAVKYSPDIAIVDISLPSTNGLELTKNLCARFPTLKVLVVSMHDEKIYAQRALRAGAKGFLCKAAATDLLDQALELIRAGGIFRANCPLTSASPPKETSKDDPAGRGTMELSDREVEVLALLGEGVSTRGIAAQLKLSIKTIDTYRDNLKRKLGLRDAQSLIRYAIQWAKCQDAG